jgi:ABC-type multidrug transport system fused ATPase/permease subunit/acyl carrier protein
VTATETGTATGPTTGTRRSLAVPRAGRAVVRTWLAEQLRAEPARTATVLGLVVAAAVAGLAGPLLLGRIVDTLVDGGDPARIDTLALWFLGVLLAQTVCTRWARSWGAAIGEGVLARTRGSYVRHVLALPLGTVERVDAGELVSRSTADVEVLDEGVRSAVPEILTAAVTLVLTLVAMVLVSPLLSLVSLVTLPPLLALGVWYRRRAGRAYENVLGGWASVQSSVHETVAGAQSVATLRLGPHRTRHHAEALRVARAHNRRAIDLRTVFFPGLEFGVFLPLAVLLLAGAYGVQQGLVGLGALTAMVLYVERLSEPLADVLTWLDELQLGGAALRRILGVREIEGEAPGNGVAPDGREVRLDGIGFGYTPGVEVLHDVDLVLPAGSLTVLVGPSGAGKTTLGRLVAGLHRPTSGAVTVGGARVDTLPATELRRAVVMVTQEQHVFAGTVRENLALVPAREGERTDREVWAALDAVGAGDWVRDLDHGLDGAVGDGGATPTPAQSQQLALARVVLADPPVAVLDEVTSALDRDAARGVERSLTAALAGRTVLAVSHHLDIAAAADRVVVVADGRIVESGRHDELVAAGGRYAALWAGRNAETHRQGGTELMTPTPTTGSGTAPAALADLVGWVADLLDRPAGEIDTGRNLYELEIDSLDLIRIARNIHRTHGVRVTTQQMLDPDMTLDDLGRMVGAAAHAGPASSGGVAP